MRHLTLTAVVLFALAPAIGRSQSPADDLADLRGRIENLERENRHLQESLVQRLPGADETVDPAGAGDTHLPSMVDHYLAERTGQMVSTSALAPDGGLVDPAVVGSEVGQDLSMTATWRNGLELSSKDKAFRLHVGGRWQMDVPWLSAEPQVNANLPGGVMYQDGIDFRRARIRLDGTMYENIEFAMEYDFVNGFRERNAAAFSDVNVTALTDMYLQFSHTPIGNLRIGNHKEAIGFEHLVSSRFLPFMERSYNQDTFYGGSFNGFSPGASLFDNFLEERASWNLGIYKPTNNVFGFNNNDGDYAVNGRLTWLPVYENEGRQLIHVGMSGRHATTYDDRIRYRTRDAMRAGVSTQWPVPADVSVFGDTLQWINAEFAAVNGPWTLQAEWLFSFTQDAQRIAGGAPVGPEVETLTYQGGYVQLLYFLTGESDNYSLERMALDRVKPFENHFWVRGDDCSNYFARGAWQVGARYNYLDLNDEGINGGELHNVTVGLNWFFNPNTKWQLNYIGTYRDVTQTADFPDGSGWINGVGMRFAQDF